MSEINDALGVSGAGCTLTAPDAKGDLQTWHFTPLPQDAKGMIESWLEERAWQKYQRAKSVLSADDLEKLFEHISQQIDEGEYSITSGLFRSMLERKDVSLLLYFAQLLLKSIHPAVTRQDVEAILKADPDGVALMVRRLYPNALTPAANQAAAGESP